MKISIKELGPIKQAEFTLGDLTIICGENNTGKTYATYALHGFLACWGTVLPIVVPHKDVQKLLNEGSIELNIQTYIDNAQSILNDGCKEYTKLLQNVFSSSNKLFRESQFRVVLEPDDIRPLQVFERTMGAVNAQLFSISKKADSPLVTVSLLLEQGKVKIQPDIINRSIGIALKDIILGNLFHQSFVVSAERTGAALFRKELPFVSTKVLSEPFDYSNKNRYMQYALPVNLNIEITRYLEEIARRESYIAKECPDILDEFSDIVGGSYLIAETDMLYFIPKGTNIKLTMGESSSSVRSLLVLAFYLSHLAAKGDLLIIDEPELNLHPENQRRMARLFSRLVNIGIKVFITTHSDYIVKELNTLIMLNQGGERLEALAKREGYKPSELLNPGKAKVYMARDLTLVPADIDEQYGIEAPSFDKTINDMNRIQDKIVWGGDE